MRNNIDWEDLNILVTGGTGSFGKKFVEIMLRDFRPNKIIIFSRDELKQHEMRISGFDDPSLRFFIGDVRDRNRLKRAMREVDVVIHAAALKQVPSCEYNPFEAVKTNILGAQNIIDAAIDCGVKKIVALSTDKAVNPVNLYGATKLCSDKIFIQGNAYTGAQDTRFSCVRYGNVIGSRGSVIPLFIKQRKKGKITITDKRMTRFWLSLEHAVAVVIKALVHMQGGEIFVPKIPSMKIVDLAEAIAPDCDIEIIGIRPGEKLHEILITEEDGRYTVDYDGLYVIMPQFSWWRRQNYQDANALPDGFLYSSNNNDRWLTLNQLKNMALELSTPLEQTGSPGSFNDAGHPKKRVIHKTKSRAIAPVKNIDFSNNIPT
ncbi:MAG: UDP-N-acetylglucosamine 4,6-dehydratase (inverting) [Deltaproteobacteria bacterium]